MDNEKKTKYKVASQVSKANEDGSIKFHLITDDVDRDSEVLLPMGAVLDNWKQNNVWLWAHNIEAWGGLERPPIGKININTIEQTEHFLGVDVFFDEKNDEFAKMIANKHRDGFLNATSVGFIPITVSTDTVKPDQKGVTFEKFEVLEGSSVPIPANPAALQQNSWGSFVDDCKKYGFTNLGMKVWMQMAGWSEQEIKDGLPNDNLTMVIPYAEEKYTSGYAHIENLTTTTENYEISDVSDGQKDKKPESDDSEADVEVDEKLRKLNVEKLRGSLGKSKISIDEIAAAIKTMISNGMTEDEAEAAIIKAVKDLVTPKEENDSTYKLIIDELNSINIYSEPDASTQILSKLKEIEIS